MNPFAKFTLADVEEFNRRTAERKLKKQPISTTATITAAVSEELLKKKTAKLNARPPRKLESEIQSEIEDWLMTQAHQCWWDRKRMDRPTTSRVGVLDFIGSWRGAAFGLEVKQPGEKLSDAQNRESAWMKKSGAVVGVAFSKDDAVAFFKNIDRGLTNPKH